MARGERFKGLRGLTLAAQILFWSIAAVEAVALSLWLAGAVISPGNWETFYSFGGMAFLLGLILHVPTFLLLPAWTAVTAAARPKMPGDALRLWAWLGYLIPAVNYVAPVLVLLGLAREAAPHNSGLRLVSLFFWLARLPSSVTGAYIFLSFMGPGLDERQAAIVLATFAACLCAGSLLGAQLVQRLSRAVMSHTTGTEQAEVF